MALKTLRKGKRSVRFGVLPHTLALCLQARGVETDALRLVVKGDMDARGLYTHSWLLLGAEAVYFLTANEAQNKGRGKRGADFVYTLATLENVPLAAFENPRVERYVNTGAVLYENGAQTHVLTRFGIGLAGDFQCFCDAAAAARAGEDITPLLKKRQSAAHRPADEKRGAQRKAFLRIFTDFKFASVAVILFATLEAATAVFIPLLSTQSLFDNVLNAGNADPMELRIRALGALVLALLGIKLLREGCEVLHSMVMAKLGPAVVYQLKRRIFGNMQRLSLSFYSGKQTGSLMERVTDDTDRLYWFIVNGLPFLVVNAAKLIFFAVAMFLTSWRLTLVVLCAIPPSILVSALLQKTFRRLHRRSWNAQAAVSSLVSDNINGQRMIKAFAKEDYEYGRFSKISGRLRDAQLRLIKKQNWIYPVLAGVLMILATGALIFGGFETIQGRMSLGQLLTFTAYITMIQAPLDFLSSISDPIARSMDALRRILEVIHSTDVLPEPAQPARLENWQGKIEIKELTFEYEPARPVIKNVSLSLEPGRTLGIVGKTGAGKSTIANLIARLYDPKSGAIYIDGTDVREIEPRALRRNIGMVSQDIYLFNGTIADNIRYADRTLGMDAVIAAAKTAAAHDFIMALPDGYETYVGASGQALSGGERQRVSIARAVLQNPKILILDEATAAMDTATERAIQESLEHLQQNRTTIAIAHRLSTLRNADLLCVIDGGEATEFGGYNELLARRGAFWNLVQIQNKAFAAIGVPADAEG
jgi:ATP-binding cassette subfamily B protein